MDVTDELKAEVVVVEDMVVIELVELSVEIVDDAYVWEVCEVWEVSDMDVEIGVVEDWEVVEVSVVNRLVEVAVVTVWVDVVGICVDVVKVSVDGIVKDEETDCKVDVLITVFELAICVDVKIEVGVTMVTLSVGAVSVWSVEGSACVDD